MELKDPHQEEMHKDPNPSGSESPTDKRPWWRRVFDLLQATGIFHPDEWPVRRMLALALMLGGLVILIAVMRHGVVHVKESQVGVKVNNWSGELQLRNRVGYHVFVPYLSRFYVLDKTIQRMDMSWSQGVGGAGNDVKIKTSDGSDVSLDITVTYKLIPEKAVMVLRRSGQDMRFSELWVEPFVRYACFSAFGQLSTEQMYDAVLRSDKAQQAQDWLNAYLNSQGIEIIALIPVEFRFYREYEEVIAQKKLADQQVEEQQAQARALLQDQERKLIEAQKRRESQLVSFEGECANRIIQARAEMEKGRREADGYYRGTILAADAALYSASSEAVGKRATLFAEAEGLESLQQALAGQGGMSMVGLEYARRLNQIRFLGTPITREPTIRQFSVQPDEAAAAQRSNTQPEARTVQPGQTQRMPR
jgi:regulator of protease activity HflC (stomatin/prohibitin superfamily)